MPSSASVRCATGTAWPWYTAHVTIMSDGDVDLAFDYDREPEWSTRVVPATYLEDLEVFPRTEDNLPVWLRGMAARPH